MKSNSSRLGRLKSLFAFDNWFDLLVQRTLFRGSTLQSYRLGDQQMIVDHRGADTASIRACFASPMYRQFLDQIDLPERLTVLDVGRMLEGSVCY